MPHLLVIAHAPLASALRQVAEHTFPDCAPTLTVLDVLPGQCADDVDGSSGHHLNAAITPCLLDRLDDACGGRRTSALVHVEHQHVSAALPEHIGQQGTALTAAHQEDALSVHRVEFIRGQQVFAVGLADRRDHPGDAGAA